MKLGSKASRFVFLQRLRSREAGCVYLDGLQTQNDSTPPPRVVSLRSPFSRTPPPTPFIVVVPSISNSLLFRRVLQFLTLRFAVLRYSMSSYYCCQGVLLHPRYLACFLWLAGPFYQMFASLYECVNALLIFKINDLWTEEVDEEK